MKLSYVYSVDKVAAWQCVARLAKNSIGLAVVCSSPAEAEACAREYVETLQPGKALCIVYLRPKSQLPVKRKVQSDYPENGWVIEYWQPNDGEEEEIAFAQMFARLNPFRVGAGDAIVNSGRPDVWLYLYPLYFIGRSLWPLYQEKGYLTVLLDRSEGKDFSTPVPWYLS